MKIARLTKYPLKNLLAYIVEDFRDVPCDRRIIVEVPCHSASYRLSFWPGEYKVINDET